MSWREWGPYVPVAQRRKQGKTKASRLLRKGEAMAPVQISGRAIATTFWGKAWCDHFEQYSDYSNRLPRGRTYARNGSILHLRIEPGRIEAIVCGSDLYQIKIEIDPLGKRDWQRVCDRCATSVNSLIDLMRGKLPEDVIRQLTDPKEGLFPNGKEIRLKCSCPDWATMCKHVAAVIYGVGNRLDQSPEMLFQLRGVDQNDLIGQALARQDALASVPLPSGEDLLGENLSDIFGIELDSGSKEASSTPTKKATGKRRARTKTDEAAEPGKAAAKGKAAATGKSKAVGMGEAKGEAKVKVKVKVKSAAKRMGSATDAKRDSSLSQMTPTKKKLAAKKISSRVTATDKAVKLQATEAKSADRSKPSKPANRTKKKGSKAS